MIFQNSERTPKLGHSTVHKIGWWADVLLRVFCIVKTYIWHIVCKNVCILIYFYTQDAVAVICRLFSQSIICCRFDFYKSNYNYNLQRNRFIPNWIQRCFNGFGFLLNIICIRNQLQFHIRIAQAIWIHWNQISALFNYWWTKQNDKNDFTSEWESSNLLPSYCRMHDMHFIINEHRILHNDIRKVFYFSAFFYVNVGICSSFPECEKKTLKIFHILRRK